MKYFKKECHPDGLLYGTNTTNTNKSKCMFFDEPNFLPEIEIYVIIYILKGQFVW